MLKQPGPQDVCRNFRKNAPFLLILFAIGVVVLFSGAVPAADAGVTRLTCNTKDPSYMALLWEGGLLASQPPNYGSQFCGCPNGSQRNVCMHSEGAYTREGFNDSHAN